MLQQNVHKVKSKEQEKTIKEERLREKLQKRYEKRPYSERWAVLDWVANVFSWLFTGYAFLIEAFAIAFGMWLHYKSTVSIVAGIFVGIVVSFCIEALKRVCNHNFFNSGISEGDWSGSNFGGMALTLALSTGLAYWGGINLPEATTTPPAAVMPEQENIETIRTDYDAQIASIDSSIQQYNKDAPRWKGKMSKESIKKLGEMNTALNERMEEKNTAIRDAKHRNRQKISDNLTAYNAATSLYKEEKEEVKWLFGLIALIVELLNPLTFFFKERYYWNCILERGISDGHTPPLDPIQNDLTQPLQAHTQPQTPQRNNVQNPIITPIPPNQAPPSGGGTLPHSGTAPERVQIRGFVHENTQENEPKKSAETGLYKGFEHFFNAETPVIHYKIAETDLYKGFEPVFEPTKEPVKEEPKEEPKEPEAIVLKSTHTHIKESGDPVEMTLTQVRGRVAQYQTRVDEAIQKIETASSDGDASLWKEVHRDRAKVLAYWKQAEERLCKQLQALTNLEHVE